MKLNSIITSFNQFNYKNWDFLLGFFSNDKKKLEIILKNALPFTILLPSQVERLTHLGLTVINCSFIIWDLASDIFTRSDDDLNRFPKIVNLTKYAVDFAADLSTSKWASIAHTAVSLSEHGSAVTSKDQRINALNLIASDTFFLLSILPISKKRSLQLMVISIGFQALCCFYRMGQEIRSSTQGYSKYMTVVSQGLMGCIHALRAYGCYCALRKIQQTVFIVMRHADKDRTQPNDPNLTDDGKIRSKIAATVIEKLRQKYRKGKVKVVVSSFKRSQQTGDIIAQELGISSNDIVNDSRIRERERSKMAANIAQKLGQSTSLKNVVNDPSLVKQATPDEKAIFSQYESYKTRPKKQRFSQEQRFYHQKLSDLETGVDAYKRMHEGITDGLDHDETTLTVFVSHAIAIRKFFQGLREEPENGGISESLLEKGRKFCEISVVERTGSQDQGYAWRLLEQLKVDLPNISS